MEPNQRPPSTPSIDHLTLKIGQIFEASASGRLAIIAVLLIATGFAGLAFWGRI